MFIAFGMFDILNAADDGRAYTGDFNTGQVLHSVFGLMVIPLLAIIMLIVSFFARIPGGVKYAGIVFGLVVLQFLLALVVVPGAGPGRPARPQRVRARRRRRARRAQATTAPPSATEPAAAV